MDYADDDAVSSFERWEAALVELVQEDGHTCENIHKCVYLHSLVGDSAFTRMKREAIINAARIPGTAHLERVQKAFPNLELVPLVEALRVKVVVRRLEGK